MNEFPNVVTVLRAAGERIARSGLIKGVLQAPGSPTTCRVCSFGALNWAIAGNPMSLTKSLPLADRDQAWAVFSDAESYLLDAIAQENPAFGHSGVPEFNDDPGTTTEQVVHVFAVATANAERDARAS